MAKKKFHTTAGALQFHLTNVNIEAEKALEEVSKRFAADTNDQFVPELTARLKNSVFERSTWSMRLSKNRYIAILRWQTPYARRRFYEGSVTGVALWTLANQSVNANTYRDMLIQRIRRI